MREEELIRKLNSVGKRAFVEYYELYKEYAEGRVSRENCIEKQVVDGLSNESGASIRCGNAKQIFSANMQCEALEIITGSDRLPSELIDKAINLIQTYC